jgi:hypothetical protein
VTIKQVWLDAGQVLEHNCSQLLLAHAVLVQRIAQHVTLVPGGTVALYHHLTFCSVVGREGACRCVLPLCCAHAVCLDVNQNGKLLTPAACISRYPQLHGVLYSQPAQHHHPAAAAADISSQIGWLPPDAAPQHNQPVRNHAVLQPPNAVTVWASLARSMVTAHQRRGESDLVVHWLFQLLALDTQAVEWGHVLKP